MNNNFQEQFKGYKNIAKKGFIIIIGLLIAFLLINSSILVLSIYNYFEIQDLKEQISQKN